MLHTKTKRDYVQRVVDFNKGDCSSVAIQYGKDYWDGDRQFGYGGYKYDGRWRKVAEAMVKHYDLKPGAKILDVGCGKGFLLYEFTQILPQCEVAGIDISEYGIKNSKEEIRPQLQVANATKLPFDDNTFDFVYSITTLHNLMNFELNQAVSEIERVGKGAKHITIESYRNEHEKANLLYWQLTCRSFYKPEEWEWAFKQAGYTGDYGAIYFE
ncbi:SAM-dependent methyltransferase [bacterium K02(2017)]|nr:SAM-dependent methyltransferase [bacterium K02(2017)]